MAAGSQSRVERLRAPGVLEWTAFSFVYWIVFMGALAPGNISNDLRTGAHVDLAATFARLTVAGVLGASVTPLLLWIAQRAPLGGAHTSRNLAIQGSAVLGLSVLLNIVSSFLAAWSLEGRLLPTLSAIEAQLFANVLLLFLCQSLLLAAIFAAPRLLRTPEKEWAERLTIGERGHSTVLDLNTVEWIEAQGNYQALHANGAVHLLRSNAANLESRLNPAKFVRVHRSHIVALAHIREIEPLPSGDAVLVMQSGARVRQARKYRGVLREHLRAG
ncbi:MAG: LytTR family transcriptional regulator [Proteobacteria bacterium]|nr:LytTR family transcriptional regulator [Pseudomonadota bacterium]